MVKALDSGEIEIELYIDLVINLVSLDTIRQKSNLHRDFWV